MSQRIVPPKNQIRPLLNDSSELINHLSPITWFQTSQLDEALQQEINKSNRKPNSTFFKLIVLYISPTSQTNNVHVPMSVSFSVSVNVSMPCRYLCLCQCFMNRRTLHYHENCSKLQ